jgi:hypothetical protein
MGQVLPFYQLQNTATITDMNRFVPSGGRRIKRAQCVLAAMWYGSALTGFSQRSDVDCLIVYRTNEEARFLRFLKGLIDTANKSRIKFSPVIIDEYCGRKGIHTINRSLASHLEEASKEPGAIIVGRPLDYLLLDNKVAIPEDVGEYLGHKIGYFNLTSVEALSIEEYFKFLGKILGITAHVCRKVLKLWHISPINNSAACIVTTYLANVNGEAHKVARALFELDCEYTSLLEEQIKHPNADSYLKFLKRIEKAAKLASLFCRLNAELIL